jgi:Asp-tRNA(Asn)/Glu-tRNA(Gln) amidotransferase A subunit family amidase
MRNEEIITLTASKLAQKVPKKEVSVQKVIEAYIKRIEEIDKQLNAFYIPFSD